jgi:hypothetical protein
VANDLQVTISASVKGLIDGLQQASSAVKENTAVMEGTFHHLVETVEKLKAPFMTMAAVVGGGALFKEAISEANNFTGEVFRLSRALGVSTEEASGLKVAIGKLGIDSDTYITAVYKLQMALRTNEAALNANGVATRNAKNEHLAIQDVMQNGLGRIKQLKSGYDANALSQLMFGRGAKEMAQLQLLTNERLADGAEEARHLGLVVTQDGVLSMRAYKDAVHDVHEVFEALQIKLGQAVLPLLTKLAHLFSSMGGAIVSGIGAALKGLFEILGYTSIQLSILAAVLYGPLKAAFVAGSTAVLAFVASLQKQYSLALATAMMQTNNLAATFGLSAKEAAKMGLAVGPSLGNRLTALGSVVGSMINPLTLVIAALVGGAFALERFMSSNTRAAKEAAEASRAFKSQTTEYMTLAEEAKRLDAITVKNGYSTSQVELAQKKLHIVLEQLNNMYPGFNKLLEGEDGHHRSITEALKLQTAELEKQAKSKLDSATAEMKRLERAQDAYDAEKAQREALEKPVTTPSTAGLSALTAQEQSAALGAQLLHGWLAKGVNAMSAWRNTDVSNALKEQRQAVLDLTTSYQSLLGEVGKPAASFVDAVGTGRFKTWEKELEQIKGAEENWFSWDVDRESSFWQAKLAMSQKGSGEYEATLVKVNALRKATQLKEHEEQLQALGLQLDAAKYDGQRRIDLANQMVQEEVRLHKEGSKEVIAAQRKAAEVQREVQRDLLASWRSYHQGKRDLEMDALKVYEDDLAFQVEMGELTTGQMLEMTRASLDRKYELERQGNAEALANEELTMDQRRKLLNKGERDYQQYLIAVHKLNQAMAANQMAVAMEFINPFVSAFQSGLQKMLRGQISFAKAVSGIWSITFDAITQGVSQLVADWVKAGLKMLSSWISTKMAELGIANAVEGGKASAAVAGATVAGAADFALLEEQLAAAEVRSVAATGQIVTNAAVAGSGAAASASSTPGIGWILAIPAMVAVVAGVMALRSMVGSAAGGWDIGNENPMGQLHAKEMVLPARYAEGFRQIINNHGNVEGSSGGGPTVINIHATDSVGIDRVLQNRKATIIKIVEEAWRNGRYRKA